MSDVTFRHAASTGYQWLKTGRGLLQYLWCGQAGQTAWHALLNLHCRTNGRATDMMTGVMRRLCPPPRALQPFDSLLGHFDAAAMEDIAAQIARDGYYVFENRIPETLCDAFYEACRHIEARTSRDPYSKAPRAKFDPENPVGFVYDLPEAEVWKVPSAQAMIADPVFVNVSQAYFKATPALKDFNVWWSAPRGGKGDAHSAQAFHFDYDPAPIWLKFFVYITDVTAETGPHVYARGSHRNQQPRMREMLSRGYVRISDEEITQTFGPENVMEITGKKGTVVAVDTLGFHKGKAPRNGHRLLAQFEFATPLFAKSVSDPVTIPGRLDPALEQTMKTYPWAFRRYRRRSA
jgi:hypothetical protein